MQSITITIIILHALVVQINAKELVLNRTAGGKNFTDVLVNKLVDRLISKLVAPMVAIPQASRPAIRGRALPSSFPSSLTVRNAPQVRHAIVPNAAKANDGSKSFGVQAKEAKQSFLDWPTKYRSLLKRGLKLVTSEEALKMMQTPFFPAKVVDVRLAALFAAGHAQGSTNVPLFTPVQGNSVFDQSKRLLSYSLGVQPTQRNPEFQAEALKQLNRNQPIIIACDRGGSVESLDDDKKAREPKFYTASLRAASELYDAGFKKLFILQGGLSAWDREGFPSEGKGVNPILKAFFGVSGASLIESNLPQS
eukprot:gnl/MRDRNA2_/MRDRNA2_30173_c0_seq1.p1 gnl/MRDRNA2_/MRDRNA2_30173_c0~~gnl/MRDRNA2_/MRDRNA2_30173_c0_seq1.p1  ORF type:complete len:308 (-),score=52.29 gnl/MRDRNA2_/MRDRNA2_30173_c0_seq1:367-1290(-)